MFRMLPNSIKARPSSSGTSSHLWQKTMMCFQNYDGDQFVCPSSVLRSQAMLGGVEKRMLLLSQREEELHFHRSSSQQLMQHCWWATG